MNIKPLATLTLSASLLAGCASTYSAQSGILDPEDFGEANRQTYAAMIVNPDPVYTEPMETSAQSAADAVERVREREVIVTTAEDTTSISGGGGGGGGR
ncbi:hypothetical protein [Aurantiacibacter rhizosphaerae]|uniref:hypothetical protein n=1 Tax=Aurantiacibacter rhizosphaerae TaxID=2691582 RepID=UPI0019214314|nr:hypothetical protein [Aurantiacibacter rhizosphaerae]